MTGNRSRLENFALAVLRLMEDDDSWNSDTMEAIKTEAVDHGLAVPDSEYFERTSSGRGENP